MESIAVSWIPWQNYGLIQKFIAKLLLASRKSESEGQNLTNILERLAFSFPAKMQHEGIRKQMKR